MHYQNYSREVLRLCGYSDHGRSHVYIPCPFCKGDKKLNFNLQKGTYRCNKCDAHGSSTDFYAHMIGIFDTKEAYKDMLNKIGSLETLSTVKAEESEKAHAFDEERTDRVYKRILKRRPLTCKHTESLIKRGFSEEDINRLSYKSVMDDSASISNIFSFIQNLGEESFSGVPGFFVTKKGNWCMTTGKRGIMVPYRSMYGKIRAIQIRKDDDVREMVEGELEHKCYYLSSSYLRSGCGASQVVHYAGRFETDGQGNESLIIRNGQLVLTEGAMKADLFYCLTGQTCMAVPGVYCTKALKKDLPELIKLGLTTILIAYDMDKLLNIHVLEALQKMIKLINDFGIEARIVNWSAAYVGLDGSKGKIDTDNAFLFSVKTYQDAVSNGTLLDKLRRVKELGRTSIHFAFRNREEALQHETEYSELKKLVSDQFTYSGIFWNLKLKGIDDYYAYHVKGITPL